MDNQAAAKRIVLSHLKDKEAQAAEYQIIDIKTKQPVGKPYKGAQRTRARNRAERMNQEHGSHRYIVQPSWGEKKAMEFSGIGALITPDKKLDDRELSRAIRLAISAEHDATHLYELMADSTDDKTAKRVLQDIANEEKIHVGELKKVLNKIDEGNEKFEEEGIKEVEEML